MIIVFGTKGCIRCKKTRDFLDDNKIPYINKDFTKEPFNKKELEDILSLTENGFDDILSVRSNIFKNLKVDFNDFTYEQAIKFIMEHSEIVHRPIVIQYYKDRPLRLLIGYNSTDINILLRRDEEKYFGN
jgi:regulatory protein spx